MGSGNTCTHGLPIGLCSECGQGNGPGTILYLRGSNGISEGQKEKFVEQIAKLLPASIGGNDYKASDTHGSKELLDKYNDFKGKEGERLDAEKVHISKPTEENKEKVAEAAKMSHEALQNMQKELMAALQKKAESDREGQALLASANVGATVNIAGLVGVPQSVQYYAAESPILQLHSLAALELWRDVHLRKIIGSAGGLAQCGVLKLMRPGCPACVQIKPPLEQALESLSLPQGIMAAVDVSCMGDKGCPFGSWLQSEMQPYWNNYIPAMIGVKVLPAGYQYFPIEVSGQRTAQALSDLLRQHLVLSQVSDYTDKIVAVESQMAQNRDYADLQSFMNISPNGFGDGKSKAGKLEQQIMQQLGQPLTEWMNGLNSGMLTDAEREALSSATVDSFSGVRSKVYDEYSKLATARPANSDLQVLIEALNGAM